LLLFFFFSGHKYMLIGEDGEFVMEASDEYIDRIQFWEQNRPY